MKVKMVGGGSFYGPHGVMVSYPPGAEVDVDEADPVAVAYWQERVDSGSAELVEPAAQAAPAAKPAAAKATKATKS